MSYQEHRNNNITYRITRTEGGYPYVQGPGINQTVSWDYIIGVDGMPLNSNGFQYYLNHEMYYDGKVFRFIDPNKIYEGCRKAQNGYYNPNPQSVQNGYYNPNPQSVQNEYYNPNPPSAQNAYYNPNPPSAQANTIKAPDVYTIEHNYKSRVPMSKTKLPQDSDYKEYLISNNLYSTKETSIALGILEAFVRSGLNSKIGDKICIGKRFNFSMNFNKMFDFLSDTTNEGQKFRNDYYSKFGSYNLTDPLSVKKLANEYNVGIKIMTYDENNAKYEYYMILPEYPEVQPIPLVTLLLYKENVLVMYSYDQNICDGFDEKGQWTKSSNQNDYPRDSFYNFEKNINSNELCELLKNFGSAIKYLVPNSNYNQFEKKLKDISKKITEISPGYTEKNLECITSCKESIQKFIESQAKPPLPNKNENIEPPRIQAEKNSMLPQQPPKITNPYNSNVISAGIGNNTIQNKHSQISGYQNIEVAGAKNSLGYETEDLKKSQKVGVSIPVQTRSPQIIRENTELCGACNKVKKLSILHENCKMCDKCSYYCIKNNKCLKCRKQILEKFKAQFNTKIAQCEMCNASNYITGFDLSKCDCFFVCKNCSRSLQQRNEGKCSKCQDKISFLV
jgi:hypothetical protein